jgi:glucokinase
VHVDNDANLAGLAEWQFGAGIGHQYVLYLTISTGIGGGMITNGQVLHGQRGLAAEVGHMMIDPDGRCGCGGSVTVKPLPMVLDHRYVKERIAVGIKHSSSSELSAKQIAKAAGGMSYPISFRTGGDYLGMAIANYLVLMIHPSSYLAGCQAGDLLIEPSSGA